ncbi:DeoR/GlpR family DNA-binding transcription regulator, partial [Cellulomonas timonensis]|uniref:DeoR/GlpR family DNA-binding transcription regulator n=1 Tax=Cellulomonas timonensis TaxID=1689271 RepID=UPI00082E63B6
MLASLRQERILAAVHAHGAVRVADLVDELGVSDMTVRRDIAELAHAGLVRRVHGGAVGVEARHRSADEPGFEAKRGWAAAEKAAVARLAASLIEPGQSVALSAGTTTHLLAREIAAATALRPLTVVTNSLPVAEALHSATSPAGLDVILTGGVRTPSDALVGPVADTSLSRLRVDTAYLGVHGLDEDGLTTPNLLEAATNQALLACATQLTVLADHTKWGVVGLARIAALDEVDVLVTDSGLPDDARRALASRVGRLLLAPDDHPR